MKKLSVIQKTALRQSRQNIRDALTCASQIFIRIKPEIGILNIFLIHNKGKGPPGRSRSPDQGDFPIPDPKPAAGKCSKKFIRLFKINSLKFITSKNLYHEKANFYSRISRNGSLCQYK